VTGIRDPGLGGEAEGVLRAPFELLIRAPWFPFVTSGTLVRRGVLDAVGPFDETLPVQEDGDLWYRIAKRSDFAYAAAPLVCHRIHDRGISQDPLNQLNMLSCELRISLRHLPDVHDPPTRSHLAGRIQRTQILLQEQLLREGRRDRQHRALLDNDLAPTSLRYRLGRLVRHGPSWLGRWYASATRTLGGTRRWLARRGRPC
jgi:hypothetical protein